MNNFTINSREIAKMMGKPHNDLLKNIRKYKEILDNSEMKPENPSATFFVPITYKDANNQDRPCFLLTKKGCDMVANKMTGEKGVLFTAAYVTKFEQMEREIQLNQTKSSLSTSYIEALRQLAESEEKKVANRYSKQ
ncbi:antirepressor [Clostridium baratii]|uniref:Rha family transcriptional regulator n=1 Tax=Clostridium baratii TaxID=1561 RepID=UPI0006C251DC|nr:Rha family transcriptional regulator [Clostridium baratii]CUP04954.1 antirepressor [Clostridium baratii]